MTISIGVRRTRWPSPPSSTSWEPVPDDDIRISWNLFSEDSPDEYSELEMDDLGISVDDVLDLSLDFSPGESAFEDNGFESELLARASKVQRLYTSEQSLALLVEILKGGDPDSPSSPGNFLLPHLDTLCVVPSKMKPKPKYAELAEYLDTRKRAGFAVRELQVPLEEPKDAVDVLVTRTVFQYPKAAPYFTRDIKPGRMRDSASWPSRKEFWTNNAHARRLFDPTFQLSDEIDDEIEALEDVLAQVKRLRNDRKPAVSRLPPEVLAAVFIDVRDSSTAEQLEAEMTRRSSWLPVTQVCHHWREVSMHTQTLWTDMLLPPMSHQSIENAAKHAGSTPLSVYYRYSDKYKDAYILDAYSIDNLQPARIRTMKAAIYDEKCLALERPMPALETLELTNERGWFQVDCDLGTFFPRLSSLSIHNCLMPWDSTVFSQLHHLSLTFGRNESHFVPLASINGLFRRLSRVHTINLQHFRADYFSLTSRERVVLPPSLSSLHITEREDANHLFEFVQGIIRQDHTRITIDVRGCDPDSIDFEPAVNDSFAHHLGPDSPAALSLMTEEDRREDREFTQMTISIGVRRTRWPSPPSSTSWEP
ncbi:hypothetical protein OF83DRAFT_1180484, partial [Amylostereum chailletii]